MPLATIISAPSTNGCCSALASSQGVRIQTFALFVGRQDHRHRLRVDRLADPTESATGKCLSPDDEQLRSRKRAAGVRRPKSWEEYAEEQNNSRAIAISIWRVIVSGRLRSSRKMAAGSLLRNRGGEVSSRIREAAALKSETSDFPIDLPGCRFTLAGELQARFLHCTLAKACTHPTKEQICSEVVAPGPTRR